MNLVRFLLDRNIVVRFMENLGNTALLRAAEKDHPDIADLVLDVAPDIENLEENHNRNFEAPKLP